eukprot:1290678-Pleurochrysis_carterae.AAC.1
MCEYARIESIGRASLNYLRAPRLVRNGAHLCMCGLERSHRAAHLRTCKYIAPRSLPLTQSLTNCAIKPALTRAFYRALNRTLDAQPKTPKLCSDPPPLQTAPHVPLARVQVLLQQRRRVTNAAAIGMSALQTTALQKIVV